MASNPLGDSTGSDRSLEQRQSIRSELMHTETLRTGTLQTEPPQTAALRNARRGIATSGEMALQGPFGHSATQCMPQRLVRLVGYCAPARPAKIPQVSIERETA